MWDKHDGDGESHSPSGEPLSKCSRNTLESSTWWLCWIRSLFRVENIFNLCIDHLHTKRRYQYSFHSEIEPLMPFFSHIFLPNGNVILALRFYSSTNLSLVVVRHLSTTDHCFCVMMSVQFYTDVPYPLGLTSTRSLLSCLRLFVYEPTAPLWAANRNSNHSSAEFESQLCNIQYLSLLLLSNIL